MKRKNFIRELIKNGCYLKRHGAKHDLYSNPQNGNTVPVPRHPEIKETLCREIRKQLGLD
jgi:mRNA interferase HicA